MLLVFCRNCRRWQHILYFYSVVFKLLLFSPLSPKMCMKVKDTFIWNDHSCWFYLQLNVQHNQASIKTVSETNAEGTADYLMQRITWDLQKHWLLALIQHLPSSEPFKTPENLPRTSLLLREDNLTWSTQKKQLLLRCVICKWWVGCHLKTRKLNKADCVDERAGPTWLIAFHFLLIHNLTLS